jgi:hypothetical protein
MTNNVLHPEFDRLRRIGAEIKTILDELHRELQRRTQAEAFAWCNGNSPYEHEIDALKEKHGVDYSIEWNADGRTVKSVRVRPAKPEAEYAQID